MKKILVLILINVCFSFACVKAYYDDNNKFMVYETQKTIVKICIYKSGCCENCSSLTYDNRITYFVFDKKKATITEIQYCTGNDIYKTYNSNNSTATLIEQNYNDVRRRALHNYLETEYAKCLIK